VTAALDKIKLRLVICMVIPPKFRGKDSQAKHIRKV